MRIQTNSLPAFCYEPSNTNTVSEQTIDFRFRWNPPVSGNVTYSSQSSYDSNSCGIAKVSSVPSTSEFLNYISTNSMSMNVISGITTDGVVIFSPVNAL